MHTAPRKRRLDGVLDALASRVGILTVIGLLIGTCIAAGFYIQSVVTQLEQNHAVFRDRQTRNGFIAMSDIQRLIIVVQKAVEAGAMSAELEREFSDAADILFVRTDNFRRTMKSDDNHLQSGVEAIAALNRIIEIADQALANGFGNLDALLESLLEANTEARARLVLFLDDMRRQSESILEEQSHTIRRQQIVVLANLAGVTLVGSVALLLLRREVLGRRAREAAEKRVAYLAYFDTLTDLPNRAQFQERLQQALDRGGPVALMYVDLDDFKLINDTYGHAAGDAVLCHVGQVLTALAEEQRGFAARLGGDEFALVIPSDDLTRLARLCETVIAAVAEPFCFEGENFCIGVSIGLATTTQVDAKGIATIDMLSRVTDFALYNSKASGRKCYTLYDHVIEQRFVERRALIEDLPRAIANDDLEVHLQPKVLLPEGRIYGFEALVRWRRNGELLPPAKFIEIAEESGMVIDVDHYVLDHATALVADWNAKHGLDLSVSVNLSALHFNSPRICQWVEEALWNARLPSRLLTLEVTESTEMRDWKQARRILADLKDTGCKISIDDFGTGYSSLAYLRTMKAHELKIDRSLVEELQVSKKARLLLSSVLDIARNLELEVTIEGIENAEQARIVHEMGARCAQGFFFGRPMPPEEALAEVLAQRGGAGPEGKRSSAGA